MYKIIFIGLVALLLSGCSRSTLELKHDSKQKVTTVKLGENKTYQLNNSRKESKIKGHKSLSRNLSQEEVYTSKDVCNKLHFTTFPPLDRNQFYLTTAKKDVYKRFNYFICTTQSVSGLDFHDCEAKYVITYERYNPEGHRTEKRYLTTDDKKCFEKLKKVALSKN